MKTSDLPVPEFRTDGMFTTVLNRVKSSGKSSTENWNETKIKLQEKLYEKLNPSSLKILEMVFLSSNVTIPEMAKKIKITERAIEKNIKS